jgi:hypothetical protein
VVCFWGALPKYEYRRGAQWDSGAFNGLFRAVPVLARKRFLLGAALTHQCVQSARPWWVEACNRLNTTNSTFNLLLNGPTTGGQCGDELLLGLG